MTTILGVACEEDEIGTPRPDSGVIAEDGGSDQPLALRPGMTFTYQARMTYRGRSLGMEKNSEYTLTLTIASVNDQGPGESTLDFTASGEATNVDDWDGTADFDAWVGRLGPSRNEDRVGTDPVTAALSQVPRIPPHQGSGAPKSLPKPGTFFLDMRRFDGIRARFSQAYADQSPQVVEPDKNSGRWLMAFAGEDDTIFYYPKTRQIRLQYTPEGYLFRLDEEINTASTTPNATCFIQLMSGP